MPKGEHLKGKGGVLFKKGEPSRNKSGRPKGSLDSRTRLKPLFEMVLQAEHPITGELGDFMAIELLELGLMAKAIRENDLPTYRELMDRFEGKAKQTNNISVNAAHNLRYESLESMADFLTAIKEIEDEEKELDNESKNKANG